MPDLDERLEHLIGGLAPPVNTAGAVERVRGRMVRRRRQRRLVAGGALAAVVAVALVLTQVVSSGDRDRERVNAIGDPDPTTSTVASTTTTVPALPEPDALLLVNAKSAWPVFVAALPAGTVASDVAMSPDGPVAVTGGKEPSITLYRFVEQSGWAELHRFDTALPLAPDYALAGHFVGTDVTADGQDDFVVLDFPGADHVGGSVLSATGGEWHLLSFGDRTYVTFLSLDDAAARARYGSTLETLENDCTPDCATGTVYENHWRFDTATGAYVSVDRHVAAR